MSDSDPGDLPPSWLRHVEELLNRLRRVEEYVKEMVEREKQENEENGGGEDGDGNGNGGAGENGDDG